MKAEEKTYKHDLRQNIPAEQDTRTLDLNIYGKWSQPKTFTRKEFEAQYAQLGDEELSRAWDYLLHIKGDYGLLLDISVDREISLEFEDRAWNKFFKDTEALDHKDLSKVEGIIKKELRKFLNSNQENTEEAKYILGTDLVIYVWGETDYSDDTKFLNIQVTTKEREVLEAMTLNRLEDSKEVAQAIEKHLHTDLTESTQEKDRLKQLTQKLTELYDELGWLESLLNKDLRVGEEADIRELIEDTMYWINWHQVEIASVKGKRK